MKSTLLISFPFIWSVAFLNAQTLTDVARSKELTWYGIDFSQARFLNFSSSQMIGEITGADKNYVQKQYKKNILKTDFSTSKKRNSALDYSKLMSNAAYEIDAETVKKVVAEYDINGTGYGMLFVVESFENTRRMGFIWIAYFNKADKKIISITRYTGLFGTTKCHGCGEWQHAITNVIKISGKDLSAYK